MEEIAINIIKDGGMVAVLFVLWLVSVILVVIKIKELQRRLEDGDDRFVRFESELKTNNNLLHELVGMIKVTTRAMGHTPEERPL